MLCFRIMYYNLYLNIYNFPNILYPINTSCNTIILYKSSNTTYIYDSCFGPISVFHTHFSALSPFQRFIPILAFYPHFSVSSSFQCFIPISVFYPHFSVVSSFQCFVPISVFYPHFSFLFQFPFQPFSFSVLSRPVMMVNMTLHKRVFQKCLDFSKTRKSRQNRYKTMSLNIKFEHKKTKSKYVNFPFNSEMSDFV